MLPQEPIKSVKLSQADFDAMQNRIAVGLAKREALVRSWTAAAGIHPSRKTDEELDAEDAALFRIEPPYLGVGAAIPSHFPAGEAQNIHKAVRGKLLSSGGPKGSKARDLGEKAASLKRGLRAESSDEEEGRSGVGRAKKLRTMGLPETMKNISLDIGLKDSTTALQGLGKTGDSVTAEALKQKQKQKVVEDPNGKLGGEQTMPDQKLVGIAETDGSRQSIVIVKTGTAAEHKVLENQGRVRKERHGHAEQEPVDRKMFDAEDETTGRYLEVGHQETDAMRELRKGKTMRKNLRQETKEWDSTDQVYKYSKLGLTKLATNEIEPKLEHSTLSTESDLNNLKAPIKLGSVEAVGKMEPHLVAQNLDTLSKKSAKKEKKKRRRERKRLLELERVAKLTKSEA